ncbi:MAG TPA: M20 family metallopeptidase [Acidothermaceae bacterium]|nr:M20 family metallopeptidase [Acidothermaceae bacterium]
MTDLVGIDSQIPPHADERAIVRFVSETALALGLPTGEVVSRHSTRPNLIIRIPGVGGGPTLILNGHLDTKPVGDARELWRTPPLSATRVGENIFGLGVSDMKAAVACMVYAAHAVIASGTALRGDLILALVADEEAGATYGSRFVAPLLAGVADACLIGEPSGWERDWQGMHLVSRGLCAFQVHVQGTQMHSSLSDRMPSVNANIEMAKLILRLKRDFDEAFPLHDPAPTLNVAVTARGGVFYGVVPGDAAFGCDLRTVPGMAEADVHAFFDGWARDRSDEVGGASVRILYDDVLSWIPSSEISAKSDLVSAVEQASAAVLGAAPPPSVFPGATDAPWFDAAGIPTLASFGPGILTYCHGPNEFVRVEAIHQAARIYARTVLGYCGVGAT